MWPPHPFSGIAHGVGTISSRPRQLIQTAIRPSKERCDSLPPCSRTRRLGFQSQARDDQASSCNRLAKTAPEPQHRRGWPTGGPAQDGLMLRARQSKSRGHVDWVDKPQAAIMSKAKPRMGSTMSRHSRKSTATEGWCPNYGFVLPDGTISWTSGARARGNSVDPSRLPSTAPSSEHRSMMARSESLERPPIPTAATATTHRPLHPAVAQPEKLNHNSRSSLAETTRASLDDLLMKSEEFVSTMQESESVVLPPSSGIASATSSALELRLHELRSQPTSGLAPAAAEQKPAASNSPGLLRTPLAGVTKTQLDQDAAGLTKLFSWNVSFLEHMLHATLGIQGLCPPAPPREKDAATLEDLRCSSLLPAAAAECDLWRRSFEELHASLKAPPPM